MKEKKKKINNAACGLHTASSNEIKNIKINDTACRLHTVSSNDNERNKE